MNYDVNNILVIRSANGPVGNKLYVNPVRDPKTGRFPEHVKPVNSLGELSLTEKEKNSGKIFIEEDRIFIVEDGTTFNLDDPYDAAEWHAIQHCSLIAMSRNQKDESGNYIIDGGPNRYGVAEFYIERPGQDTVDKVSKKRKIHQAETFIFDDPKGTDGRRTMARILGRNMTTASDADVSDYLTDIAEKNPDRIIGLYTGSHTHLRILLIDAKEKGVITVKDRLYVFNENTLLGASEDSVIEWMKMPANSKILELIKQHTYPELMYSRNNIEIPKIPQEFVDQPPVDLTQYNIPVIKEPLVEHSDSQDPRQILKKVQQKPTRQTTK